MRANGYIGLAKIEDDKVNVCGLFRLEPKLAGKGTQTLERYLHAGGLAAYRWPHFFGAGG